MKFIQETRRVH